MVRLVFLLCIVMANCEDFSKMEMIQSLAAVLVLIATICYAIPSLRKTFLGVFSSLKTGFPGKTRQIANNHYVKKNEEKVLSMDHYLFSSNLEGPSLEKALPGFVPRPDCKISLCFKNMKNPFQHKSYHIKIENEAGQMWVIRFSQNDTPEKEGNLDGRITVETLGNDHGVETEGTTKLTDEMLERIGFILPATNFSHCLRNSEHLSRYIFEGKWVSIEMQTENDMRKFFGNIFEPHHSHLIGTTPDDLQKKEKIIDPTLLFNDFEMATYEDTKVVKDELKLPKNAYNIVVVGPTGAGKSTITNILFNLTVCGTGEGTVSPGSVTRNFELVHGKYRCQDGKTIDINVIDTMGFCDQFVEDDEAIRNLSSKILDAEEYIDKVVFVVCKTPISTEHKEAIKSLLYKLKYKNYKDNFLFLYSQTEDLQDDKKRELVEEMGKDLGVNVNREIKVIKPDPIGVLKTNAYISAGRAVGVNPKDYTTEASRETVQWIKEALLPHSSDVLQGPKRTRSIID